MNKIRIIDLLNKIANGEEVPKKFIYEDNLYYLQKEKCYRSDDTNDIFESQFIFEDLNNEIEIIEEPQPTQEEINKYTKKFLEVWEPVSKQFGKLFDELIRIKNDSGLNLEDNIKEEPQEHKIPQKLEIEQDTPNSNFYIRNEYGTKCALTKHSKIIADKINEILDYLEEIE